MGQDLIRVRSADGRGDYWIDEDSHTVSRKDANGSMVTVAGLTEHRDLGVGDVHIPSALANYAAGYRLAPAISEIVAPAVLTDKASDYFFTFDSKDAFQPAQTLLASEGDRMPEISPRLSSTLFTTVPRGLASFVPQGVIANADAPLNPRMAAINRIMNAMLRAREDATAAAFSASAFSGYTSAIAAGAKWNGGASSDPIADLHKGIEAALLETTHIVMSEQVAHDFVRNPNVSKFVLYKDNKEIDTAALSSILHLPPIVIGKMKGTSATTGSLGYVWGTSCLLLHNPPGLPVDGQTICTGKTFRWNKGGIATDGNGFRVRMWFDPNRGQDGGEMVAVVVNEVPTVTSAASGYLLTACHQ